MLPCLLAAAIGAGAPPGEVTIKTEHLEAVMGQPGCWTVVTIRYQDTPMTIDAGGQGAVIRPAEADWIGGAMSAGAEQVHEVTIEADGEPVETTDGATIEGDEIVVTKTSLLASIRHTARTTFEGDLMVQEHAFSFTEDIHLNSFYAFIYSLAPTMTHWMARAIATDATSGQLAGDGGHPFVNPAEWLVCYDAAAGKGAILYFVTQTSGAAYIWDTETYRKCYLQPMHGDMPKGRDLAYKLVMKMFSADADDWQETAKANVEQLAERFPASAPTAQPNVLYDEGVPEQGFMAAKTEGLRVIFQAESAWTIDEIHHEGEQLAGPTGHYGSVLIPAGGNWIGTGHTEGGREIVHSLRLTVDGQERPVEIGAVEGHEIELVKTSTIHKFDATHTITITDDEIIERAQLNATEDHDLSRMYLFMHCWPKETTRWIAELPDGEIVEGLLESDKDHAVDQDARWVAQYHPGRHLGLLCYTPKVAETDTSKSFIWDQERYHKYYVQHNHTMSFAAGDELDFTMVVKIVSEETGDWEATKAAAAHLAERYPHLDDEEDDAGG